MCEAEYIILSLIIFLLIVIIFFLLYLLTIEKCSVKTKLTQTLPNNKIV